MPDSTSLKEFPSDCLLACSPDPKPTSRTLVFLSPGYNWKHSLPWQETQMGFPPSAPLKAQARTRALPNLHAAEVSANGGICPPPDARHAISRKALHLNCDIERFLARLADGRRGARSKPLESPATGSPPLGPTMAKKKGAIKKRVGSKKPEPAPNPFERLSSHKKFDVLGRKKANGPQEKGRLRSAAHELVGC